MLGAMGSEYAVILMHDCSQKFVRENGALKILLQSKKIATCYFPAPNIPKHQLIVWIGRLQINDISSITSPLQPSVEGQNHHRALWDHQWRLRGIEVVTLMDIDYPFFKTCYCLLVLNTQMSNMSCVMSICNVSFWISVILWEQVDCPCHRCNASVFLSLRVCYIEMEIHFYEIYFKTLIFSCSIDQPFLPLQAKMDGVIDVLVMWKQWQQCIRIGDSRVDSQTFGGSVLKGPFLLAKKGSLISMHPNIFDRNPGCDLPKGLTIFELPTKSMKFWFHVIHLSDLEGHILRRFNWIIVRCFGTSPLSESLQMWNGWAECVEWREKMRPAAYGDALMHGVLCVSWVLSFNTKSASSASIHDY